MPPARKVLLVSDHGSSGGTRDYLGRLLRFYLESGWEVLFLAVDPSGADLVNEDPGVTMLAVADVLGHGRIPVSPWDVRGVRREREAFDAVARAHDASLVVASVGTPGALLTAVQTVRPSLYVLHTYPHGRRTRLLGSLRFAHALDDVSRVVTVSDAARQQLIRGWGLERDSSRISTVYSTMGPSLPCSSPVEQRDLVLALGHVEAHKGPDVFIDVALSLAPRFPTVTFVWAGEGLLLPQCRRRVEEAKMSDRIRFIGHAHDTDALYRRALVYVQPSRVESLGLALLDAGRHGIASVVPAVGGMPEVVVDGHTGLVVPTLGGATIAEGVARLLSDAAARTDYGMAAAERYGELFTEDRWVNTMSDLHRDLLRD